VAAVLVAFAMRLAAEIDIDLLCRYQTRFLVNLLARHGALETWRNNLRLGNSIGGIGITLALLLTSPVAILAQTPRPPRDAMVKNGPPIWDANHDGVFTCDEWKSFADRIFTSADRNHDGKLDPSEFATVQKADAALADSDFGYFDENQDGKIARQEFVEKPNAFILRFDRNSDCRVTPAEMKATMDQESGPKGPPERTPDRFH
jgi:Ca2+-binding EF-hand superfamily protein